MTAKRLSPKKKDRIGIAGSTSIEAGKRSKLGGGFGKRK